VFVEDALRLAELAAGHFVPRVAWGVHVYHCSRYVLQGNAGAPKACPSEQEHEALRSLCVSTESRKLPAGPKEQQKLRLLEEEEEIKKELDSRFRGNDQQSV
jgi:hypothetical protein